MTTDQDREMAECVGCGFCPDGMAEYVASLLADARQQGRREGLEEAMKALEADAQLCDCHAYSEDECACGAWCEWKTVPIHRAVEIVRKLGEA